MKRSIFQTAIACVSVVGMLVAAGSAFAARYGDAGCGLGSKVITQGGFMQVSAATTNGTSYNQLFGISSESLNCVPEGSSKAMMKQESFVIANYATLTKEMAKGHGATLAGLAETLGCPDAHLSHFGMVLKDNYENIVASPGTMAMLETVKVHISNDSSLNASCSHLNI